MFKNLHVCVRTDDDDGDDDDDEDDDDDDDGIDDDDDHDLCLRTCMSVCALPISPLSWCQTPVSDLLPNNSVQEKTSSSSSLLV